MKKKVAILGCGRSKDKAPYDNDEYEIWSLNEMSALRFDRHFELHPVDVQNEREIEWLTNCEKPIYVLSKKDMPFIKNAIEYPLDDILAQPWAIRYFTCTMAYEMALAIHLGYEKIELWGLNMDEGSPRERTVESACLQYWCGIATGKGIKVRWSEHPGFNRYDYGYDYHTEKWYIENWLCRLLTHTIYRLGPTASMGGDNLEIRRPKEQKFLSKISEAIACPDVECSGCLIEYTLQGDITCNECGKKFKVEGL